MHQLKTLIIEDEPAVRKELEWLVSQEKNLILEATANSVEKALQIIKEIKPDLVLMDIQLKDGTAFDILNQLEEPAFHIIFITAYNHFAIKAIKFGALDYLLKPIDNEEFSAAIQKLHKTKKADYINQISILKEQDQTKLIDMDTRVCITSIDCLQMIKLNEIIYLSGEGSYTQIHLENHKKVTASKPLKYYEELLPTEFFIRTHQSYIVNKNFIDKYLKTGVMVMKDLSEIPVATRRKDFILDQLSLLK
ncbi:LytR/AlgR family response regulator transcription factor [Solitalea lacus]|uniref:LytR/AlgR family response regulator transcription factor n=1 Tax=Solitalea lacus TaxID=2911172 RepID=UPI001EDC7093|nr:LytTR family DNA-binding domain-containing protein [Solitalea lacus]UKJ08602.1 LytTR family DNA-binding domain-containing protein [Solitalea lacus]